MTMMKMHAQLGHVDEYTRTVPIIASTPEAVNGEAIIGWDLSRFAKMPAILWGHKADELPIGVAETVEWDPQVGLKMMVRFARAEANPLAEQVYQGVKDGIVRAVSVGYDFGAPGDPIEDEELEGEEDDEEEAETAEGDPKSGPVISRKARLLEVSFVTIGLDENAGTEQLNPEAADEDAPPDAPDEAPADISDAPVRAKVNLEERMMARVKRAAATLARHRGYKRRQALVEQPAVEVEVENTDARPPPGLGRPKNAEEAASDSGDDDKADKANEVAAAAHRAVAIHPSASTHDRNKHASLSREHGKKSDEHNDRVQEKKNSGGDKAKSGGDKAKSGGGGGDDRKRDDHGRFDQGDAEQLADGEVLRMDRAPIRMDRIEQTPVGGRVIPARLSRTGVLKYLAADGSYRRELRLDTEIFKPESMATLEHAAVIDIKDHTGMVTPASWKRSALGHVTGVRQDGKFINANLIVEDAATLDAIANGERTEVSCGYRCHLDMTPGVYEGDAYDCIQRDIRYNHAALCPPNRGRAGPDVALRLDSDAFPWAIAHFDTEQKELTMAVRIRLDGREMDEGSKEHLDAIEMAHFAEKADLRKRLDASEGVKDALTVEIEQLKLDAKTKQQDVEKDREAQRSKEGVAVRSRVRLLQRFLRFFGKDEEDEETTKDEDTKKCPECEEMIPADAKKCPECGKAQKPDFDKPNPFAKKGLTKKLDSMTDREIHVLAIQRRDAKFDPEGKSDDYILARFDAICESAQVDAGVNGIVKVAEDHVRRLDATGAAGGGGDPVTAARAARDKWAAEAWKPVAPTTAAK